ncbi:NmrA family NAD(P)-binding protein [Umezawaea tangerina]|uniref:NAD(P)H dehydrogenase (Quinone) n=1 Tax=Umezawaea tangerina TaxID=84725 RepID=A0A2T0T6N2_9PSEU|nr:NmrA family NAD(P)-binding protein [Umezawaea tangerina]PRY41314.1 NAD(P)H dehydrogenase (quinone) [Umezawaea tangerina]
MHVVTGATGALGRLVVEKLLDRVPASEVRATGRRPEALDDLVGSGVDVCRADYDDPASLRSAFAGADRVLFVSGNEVGKRLDQHQAVVDALAEARVGLVAYTSILNATTSDIVLAREHAATERMLADAGVPHVLLRNGWYLENFTMSLADQVDHGMIGASGAGRIAAATRADYAEAAAVVLTGAGTTAGEVFELGGPGFTRAELVAHIGRCAGRPVSYTDLSEQALTEPLLASGVPDHLARLIADSDRGAAAGWLDAGDDLERLLGRPAEPWTDFIAAAVRSALDTAA